MNIRYSKIIIIIRIYRDKCIIMRVWTCIYSYVRMCKLYYRAGDRYCSARGRKRLHRPPSVLNHPPKKTCWHNCGRPRWILITYIYTPTHIPTHSHIRTHTNAQCKDFWDTSFCWFFGESCRKAFAGCHLLYYNTLDYRRRHERRTNYPAAGSGVVSVSSKQGQNVLWCAHSKKIPADFWLFSPFFLPFEPAADLH